MIIYHTKKNTSSACRTFALVNVDIKNRFAITCVESEKNEIKLPKQSTDLELRCYPWIKLIFEQLIKLEMRDPI